MEKDHLVPELHHRDRRRHSRVAFNHSAWLTVQNKRHSFDQMADLSMGGACIKGVAPLKPGDICDLELHEEGRHSCRIAKYCSRVIRKGGNKLALEFVDMDADSYMYLQTMILYHAEDPFDVVDDFQDDFPLDSFEQCTEKRQLDFLSGTVGTEQ